MTHTDEDAEFEAFIERDPVFISSQLRPGHVLTDGDVKAIQHLISELDRIENEAVDNFQDGRMHAFREIGGEEMVKAVEADAEARIDAMVKTFMGRLAAREVAK